MKRLLLFSLMIVLALSLTACNLDEMRAPVDPEDTEIVLLTVNRGATTTSIGASLMEAGLIQSEMVFKMAAKELGADGKMQAGDYELSKSMSTDDIIAKLVAGDVVINTFTFTIPEGFEIKDITARLVAEGLVDEAKFNEALLRPYDYKFLEGQESLEGFLFPDTYEMKVGASEQEIIVRMLDRFDEIFKEEYYGRLDELGMDMNQLITLASIVEREAQAKEEFPIVSGVFHNRIEDGMLLQSCATVQYILGERKERLTYDDIAIDSPYNTYINAGLPPAPIASPGKLAIESALFPEDHNYYYFVVKKGGNGTHVFSETLSQHNKAKEENR
ncbi:endolytic transglycosylase MltG [Acidaminobacter sp. JC074]|uniref:endolytic transglycosylase MltG n=1 Tax=Acidaminobacter sp. JC074 TaxID=2530199 RepID=UPI001F0DF998|nr:endolytic transglycosylase MltG [Acidaminobacter sp. JC074]MCH4888789.1 endolytic transglycosylase MltG [Acidaminobacter sp. JC074]